MSSNFVVSGYQGTSVVCNKEENLIIMREQMEKASASGAKLIVFPELFTTGYNLPKGSEDIKKLAEPKNGHSFQQISQWAKQYQIAVVYGYAEKEESCYYNSAQFIDKQGTLLTNYRKLHLWPPTDTIFTPGSDLPSIINYDGINIALLICYDVDFPEILRILALNGAQLVVGPTACAYSDASMISSVMVRSRARENHIFIAYINHCGWEDGYRFYGSSVIVDPAGNQISCAGIDGECLLFGNIDTSQCSPNGPSYFNNRRPELYSALTNVH